MDCAIRTDDAMVSRHHSRIFWGGAGYVLEDLSSANGVYFQEQRVQSHMFKHGDAVRCGSLWLRYVDAAAAVGPGANSTMPPVASTSTATPMMQHPGFGAITPGGQTGHVAVVGPSGSGAPPMPASFGQTPAPQLVEAPPPPSVAAPESDAEIRVLRRRVEQLQTELRVYRANKFNQDTARRMEDLEADLSAIEIERDNLKGRAERAEAALKTESGSVKVRRALEIAQLTVETAASLNDLLSSLRIEVMASEGEFEQYAQSIPRASYELIRQSMRDAALHCDAARDLLRKLREIAE